MISSTSSLHILLVDDQRSILDLVSEMLTSAGCRVSAFVRAEDALEFSTERINEIDLIVTDINLPGISGGELLNRLHELRPDLPAVAISGIPIDMHDLPGIGPKTSIPFLQKPFGMKELLSTVGRLLPRLQTDLV